MSVNSEEKIFLRLLRLHSTAWGFFGSICILIVFYLVQSAGMQSWSAPIFFMSAKWYFVLPLVAGFGIQVGIFRAIRTMAKRGGGALAASGGVSTGAMIACCMHNVVNLLPILGLSGAAVFFSAYQSYVFIVSIAFVFGGVAYMWRKYARIKSHHLPNV